MVYSLFEVPLSAKPQSLKITLANVVYQFTVQWRTRAGWVLDIASQDAEPIVQGLPLVTGADLLGQHKHLGIGGSLMVATDADLDAVPTYANLGTESHLYFVVAS